MASHRPYTVFSRFMARLPSFGSSSYSSGISAYNQLHDGCAKKRTRNVEAIDGVVAGHLHTSKNMQRDGCRAGQTNSFAYSLCELSKRSQAEQWLERDSAHFHHTNAKSTTWVLHGLWERVSTLCDPRTAATHAVLLPTLPLLSTVFHTYAVGLVILSPIG